MPYDRQYYLRNKELRAAQMRRWRYGDVIERMWEEQHGVCANPACDVALAPGKHGFQVDHDHRCCPRTAGTHQRTCGQCTRGLLCEACNLALTQGMNAEKLRGLADYFDAHPLKPRDQMTFGFEDS